MKTTDSPPGKRESFGTSFGVLVGGLLVVLFVGWKLGRKVVYEELTNDGTLPLPAWMVNTLLFLIRFVAPAALLTIAIFQIHE